MLSNAIIFLTLLLSYQTMGAQTEEKPFVVEGINANNFTQYLEEALNSQVVQNLVATLSLSLDDVEETHKYWNSTTNSYFWDDMIESAWIYHPGSYIGVGYEGRKNVANLIKLLILTGAPEELRPAPINIYVAAVLYKYAKRKPLESKPSGVNLLCKAAQIGSSPLAEFYLTMNGLEIRTHGAILAGETPKTDSQGNVRYHALGSDLNGSIFDVRIVNSPNHRSDFIEFTYRMQTMSENGTLTQGPSALCSEVGANAIAVQKFFPLTRDELASKGDRSEHDSDLF